MNEQILSKQVNELAVKLANSYLEGSNYKAQAELLADEMKTLQEELAQFKAVLESDSDLKELFEEVKSTIHGGN